MEKVLDASGLAEKVRETSKGEGGGERRTERETAVSLAREGNFVEGQSKVAKFLTFFFFFFFLSPTKKNKTKTKKLPNKTTNSKQTALHQNIIRMQDLTYKPSYSDILRETETIFEDIVGDLLKKTNTKPDEVDAVITSCSCFAPMPSLAALVVHRFGMRKDVQTYALAGMGCGASVVCVDMAARVSFFFFFRFRVFDFFRVFFFFFERAVEEEERTQKKKTQNSLFLSSLSFFSHFYQNNKINIKKKLKNSSSPPCPRAPRSSSSPTKTCPRGGTLATTGRCSWSTACSAPGGRRP